MDDLAAAAAATTTTAANRGTAQFEAVDAETRAVMQSRINPSSRAHYDSENTKFILWLFDNREHYSDFLQPALLNELALQLERDKERRTQAGKPSKRRDHVRATCRQWLGGIEPNRPETYPIRLTDLDIKVYGRYLNAFKKRVRHNRCSFALSAFPWTWGTPRRSGMTPKAPRWKRSVCCGGIARAMPTTKWSTSTQKDPFMTVMGWMGDCGSF